MVLLMKVISSKYLLLLFFEFIICNELYNIPDPDCTGSFGGCTERDLAKLGYEAIKKIHESIDDNHDGAIDIRETKEFIEDELNYKNDKKRQEKFHYSDSSITVDELWKLWIKSEVYDWSVEDVLNWVSNDEYLNKYIDNFRRNKIDGRHIPRLAANENSYLSKVLKIKDYKDKSRIILISTDLVLFGQQLSSNFTIKDLVFAAVLIVSTIACFYAYTKHLKSQKLIEGLKKKFDKINSQDKIHDSFSNEKNTNNLKALENEKSQELLKELVEVKKEAERLKRSREGSKSSYQRLKFAEKELEKVREALKQRELQIQLTKTQPPKELLQLLNETYESERLLFEVRFEFIEKERNKCLAELNRLTKANSGVFGMFKIAHSSYLEEINSKLDVIQKHLQSFKTSKVEWTRRWNLIESLTSKNSDIITIESNHTN